MRIACPDCSSAYDVPDALIGAGRLLRCSKCAHEWVVTPPGGEPPGGEPPGAEMPGAEKPGAEPATVEPPPARQLPLRAPQRVPPGPPQPMLPAQRAGRPLALWGAWAASLLLVAGLAAAIWAARGAIIEAWPPAARILPVPGGPNSG